MSEKAPYTPETDAMCICTQHKSFKATGGVVNPDFARRLECERDDAKLLLEKEVSAHAKTINDLQEREDELLEQARLLGMSSEREAKLLAEVQRLREQVLRAEAWPFDPNPFTSPDHDNDHKYP